MTGTFDASERAIVDALRVEAENVGAPFAARERVAARLSARVGVAGLAASVTVVASSAGAAVVSSGAGTSGGAAVSALSIGGLSKLLVLGMALGASTGLGLHFAVQHPLVSVPARAAAGVPLVPARSEAATLSEAAPNPLAGSPVVDAPKARTPRVSPPRRASTPPVEPMPDVPSRAQPVPAETLAAQQALLDEARVALRRGDGRQALRAVATHRELFPRTAFEEERSVVAIRAELLIGNVDTAHEQAREFARSHPKSLLLPSLTSELEKASLSGFETDPAETPQSPGVGKDMP